MDLDRAGEMEMETRDPELVEAEPVLEPLIQCSWKDLGEAEGLVFG